ncbi:YcnI family copper-binding membrane protein [Bacillus thermotolerans]|uniref:YcnI family copper-binding membrane protein n=1 Tax=Bacillus thermotolerans TaxID=1221996 RepID=UPI00057CDC29|nr:YcnI family protein [Bacillus thermotolerans]KKB34415.1 Conserved membrane protein in copper uptake, YcnI [Bacillus thermotolerans]
MKRMLFSLAAALVTLFFLAGIASAHVTVLPNETTQGSYEMFTVKVPSEKDAVSTTQIKIDIPSEVNISRFEPKPDWTYDIQRDAAGKIISVTWTAECEGLTSTEFALFNMQGKVAADATEIIWKAYQTYDDGSVVEWIGAQDTEKPASVTTVHPKPTDNGEDNDQSAQAEDEEESATGSSIEEDAQTTSLSGMPLFVSIAALIIALLALILSFRRRS